jgi:hypothetical protein
MMTPALRRPTFATHITTSLGWAGAVIVFLVLAAIGLTSDVAGPGKVEITLGYVGVQPSSYPINTIFLWTGGSHEGVLQVALRPDTGMPLEALQETLRGEFRERFPDAQFSFEPGDIVGRIMNFGAPTPVEVAVMGPDFAASRTFATRVRKELAKIASLRDLQYGQTLDYQAIQVDVDRQLAGQLGVTVDQVGRSFAAATILESLRRAQLLGRPAHGHRVPGPGASAAAADGDARGPVGGASDQRGDSEAAVGRSHTHRERRHRR